MRLVVASARPPFADPAPLGPAVALARALRHDGHQVEQVWLPVDSDPGRSVQRHLSVRLTDISDAGEVMITLCSPSHLLRHPAKIVWFECEVGARVSNEAAAAERVAIGEARRVFVASSAAGRRLRQTTGVDAPVLAPDGLQHDPAEVVSVLLG